MSRSSGRWSGSGGGGGGPPPAVGEHHGGSFHTYFAHKQLKVAGQWQSHAGAVERKSGIFDGVVVYFNGRMDPPEVVLKAILAAHGGEHAMYLARKRVTHIVAANLPDEKIKQELRKKHWATFVRPAWIVDSVKAGARLPVDDYLLEAFRATGGASVASHFAPATAAAASSTGASRKRSREAAAAGAAAAAASSSSAAAPSSGGGAAQDDADDGRGGVGEDDDEEEDDDVQLVEEAAVADDDGSDGSDGSDHDGGGGGGETSAAAAPSASAAAAPPPSSSIAARAAFYANTRNSGNDPNFMKSFLSSSRLHYLGSARASVAQVVAQEAQKRWGASASGGGPGKAAASAAAAGAAAEGGSDDDNGDRAAIYFDDNAAGGEVGYGDDDDLGDDGDDDQLAAGAPKLPAAGASSSASTSAVASGGSRPRVVAHVDIDCFFAQVAILDHPHLKDAPVVVAHTGGARPSGSTARAAFGDGVDTAAAAMRRAIATNVDPGGGGGGGAPGVGGGVVVAGMYAGGGGGGPQPSSTSSAAAAPAAAPSSPPRDAATGASSTALAAGHSPSGAALLSRGREDNKSYPEYSTAFRGGEVSSANYPARAFGIHAGMSVTEARRLCPALTVLPYNFARIEAISAAVFRRFAALTPVVQAISCDEAYLDLTDVVAGGGGSSASSASSSSAAAATSVTDVVSRLRADILDETGVTVSAGVGPNMMLARMATAKAKPNGMWVLPSDPGAVDAFLSGADVTELPGVGWATGRLLDERGIITVGQLQRLPKAELQALLGPVAGETLWRYARGQDDRPVVTAKRRKTVSVEVTWGVRFDSLDGVRGFIGQLGGELASRLAAAGREAVTLAGLEPAAAAAAAEEPVRARTLTLRVMQRQPDAPESAKFMGHGRCDTFNRSVALAAPTADAGALTAAAVKLYAELGVPPLELRGVGISVGKLQHRALDAMDAAAASSGGQGLMDRFLKQPRSSSRGGGGKQERGRRPPPAAVAGDCGADGSGDEDDAADASDGDAAAVSAPSKRPRRVRFDVAGGAGGNNSGTGSGGGSSNIATATTTAVIELSDDDNDEEEGDGGAASAGGSTSSAAPAAGTSFIVLDTTAEDDTILGGGEGSRDSHASAGRASVASTMTVGSSGSDGDGSAQPPEQQPPSPDVVVVLDDTQPAIVAPASATAAGVSRGVTKRPTPPRAATAGGKRKGRGGGGGGGGGPRLAQQQLASFATSAAAAVTPAQLLAELTALGVDDVSPYASLPVDALQEMVAQLRGKAARRVVGTGPLPQQPSAAAAAGGRGGRAAARGGAAAATAANAIGAVISLDDTQVVINAAEGNDEDHASPAGAAAAARGGVRQPQHVQLVASSSSAAVAKPRHEMNHEVALSSSSSAAAAVSPPPLPTADVPVFAHEDPAALAAALRAWMVRIGPHPAPAHARLLGVFAADRVLARAGEDAVALVRTLRRYCAAIACERAAVEADPARDAALAAAWAAPPHSDGGGGAVSATWDDVLAHVEARVQEAARAVHGHALEFEL